MITMEELDRLQAICDAATPGEWVAMDKLPKSYSDHGYRGICNLTRLGRDVVVYTPKDATWQDDGGGWRISPDDPQFIAAARTAMPELIAENRRMRAAIAELEDLTSASAGTDAIYDAILTKHGVEL